jgi:hypothetical protein
VDEEVVTELTVTLELPEGWAVRATDPPFVDVV